MCNYSIQFGEYDDILLDKVVRLFSKSFYWTNKFSKKYLEWQYLDNPNGLVVSFNAFTENGELVGHYAAIPIQMIIEGEKKKGLLSLNTATHPNHQGKGLFTKLAIQTFQYAKQNGFEFVIGVANANSTHGFIKKLGFELIAPLEFKVGIGNIYKRFDPSDKNRFFYDYKTLVWRLKCPAYEYSISGNCIYSKRKEPLFHSCFAMVPHDENCELLGLSKSFDVFNIYIGLGVDRKSGLYFNLPKMIKRSPFNLIYKNLSERELPHLTKDNVFFQLIDFDVA